MKGGNLSQLNDYAMTHPAWGDCKHCEMQEKERGKRCLFSAQVTEMLISSGDSAARCNDDLEMAAAGVGEQIVCLVFETFPTQV